MLKCWPVLILCTHSSTGFKLINTHTQNVFQHACYVFYGVFSLMLLPHKLFNIACTCSYKWAPSSEFVSSSIPSWQILTAHAQPFRGARDLAFCLKVPLDSLLVWASSGGSGETARMRRLAWTFAARIGDKYQIRLTRSKCSLFACLLAILPYVRHYLCLHAHVFWQVFVRLSSYTMLVSSNVIWRVSWQNQQNDYTPSEDSDQPGHPPSLLALNG